MRVVDRCAGRARVRARRVMAVALASIAALSGAPAATTQPPADRTTDPRANLVGSYDGSQSELVAGLDIRADGRFLYLLSYGALDEQAEGTWAASPDGVLLTSDPVSPPRFVLLEDQDAPAGKLRIALELPEGMSRQYFHVAIGFADGSSEEAQLSDEQVPLEIVTPRPVASVSLMLPMLGLQDAMIALSGPGGHQLRIRFEPHDLGKVAFAGTLMRYDHDDLILQRHERPIRFRRLATSRSQTP